MAVLIRKFLGAAPRRLRLLVLALAAGCAPAHGQATPASISPEYQIKAVFLFNFAQFAEWPAKSFAPANAPLVIGVYGDDPFGPYLDGLVRDEKVGGRRLVVRRISRIDQVRDCHILYVSRSEQANLETIISGSHGLPVLTISDSDRFTNLGGMVRFVMEDGKVRLRINAAAAKVEGVVLSSKILRHATIVSTGKD